KKVCQSLQRVDNSLASSTECDRHARRKVVIPSGLAIGDYRRDWWSKLAGYPQYDVRNEANGETPRYFRVWPNSLAPGACINSPNRVAQINRTLTTSECK
ncbi:hypothetical protein K0M31_016975, partial [Melipona bicolor]